MHTTRANPALNFALPRHSVVLRQIVFLNAVLIFGRNSWVCGICRLVVAPDVCRIGAMSPSRTRARATGPVDGGRGRTQDVWKSLREERVVTNAPPGLVYTAGLGRRRHGVLGVARESSNPNRVQQSRSRVVS